MSKTSTEAKNRWVAENYGTIIVKLPKELVEEFKMTAAERGDSQASIVKKAVEDYIRG